jgi:mannosyltransferase OCH1-like enzyme
MSDIQISSQKMPSIIHQVYEDINGTSEDLLEISKTWKKFHPGIFENMWNEKKLSYVNSW